MIVICMIPYNYLISLQKLILNALTHTHVRNLSDPLLDMSDPLYSNGRMIMISLLVVSLPVAL